MTNSIKCIYKYTQPRQSIFKDGNNEFTILTQFGIELKVSLDEILVYLFCNGQSEVASIQEIISNNYKNRVIPTDQIQDSLLKFINFDLLVLEKNDSKDFHPIFPFNPFKIVKKLDRNCIKKTIITLSKLEFSITDACPFDCSYCSRKIHEEEEYINFEQKKKLVYDCFEMGAYTLNITGGEPLFGKYADEAVELVKYAKDLGYRRILVSTSGYGIIDNIDRLVNAGLDELQISYNQCTIYEEDRVRNKFIEDNIDSFIKVIPESLRFGVCCVLTRENVNKIKAIIEFCIKYKLYSVYFYPVMPVGGAVSIWEKININSNVLESAMATIRQYKEEYKDKIFISAPQSFMLPSSNIYQICEGGTYMLYATNRGNVSACACSPYAKENFKNKKIEDIWTNSEYFEMYRNIKKYKDACNTCSKLAYCLNSCTIRAMQAYQSGLKYEYEACKLNL